MSKINLGIIGAGLAWERLHSPALARLTDKFEIKAICDTNLNKAEAAAQKAGLTIDKAYDNHDQMLNSCSELQIDAFLVCVPIMESYNVAKSVIEHKRHLITEKPFASNLESATELSKLAKTKKVKVLVAENWRYDEGLKIIKDVLNNKKIGDVTYFIDNYINEFTKEMLGNTFASTEWRQHPDFSGGIFLDSGVHHIARQRFLFGEVLQIFAKAFPGGSDFCPYSAINALLSFNGHISGHYCYFNVGKETQAPLVGLRIFGTNGEIYLEDKDCGFVNITYKDGSREALPYTPGESYFHQFENFYNALVNDETIVVEPEKEIGDMKVIFGILKSIERNEILHNSDADKTSGDILKKVVGRSKKTASFAF